MTMPKTSLMGTGSDPNKYHTQSDTPHEIFTLDFSRTPKHTLHITNIFICAHTQQFQIQMDELGQFHIIPRNDFRTTIIAWVCRKRSPCLRFIIFYVHSFFLKWEKETQQFMPKTWFNKEISKIRVSIHLFIYIYLILNWFLFLNFLPLEQKTEKRITGDYISDFEQLAIAQNVDCSPNHRRIHNAIAYIAWLDSLNPQSHLARLDLDHWNLRHHHPLNLRLHPLHRKLTYLRLIS